MKNGASETVVLRSVQLLRDNEQLKDLETLLAFFASYVLEPTKVQEIVRFDMAILEQSPLYQQMAQREREQGRQEGVKQEALHLLHRLLQRRFETLPEALQTHLESLSLEELEALVDVAVTAASLEEFMATISL